MLQEIQELVDQGFFAKAAAGDTRAASLFARLVAYRLNPTGDPSKPGALRKGGGHNVDGYAEDAIVLNANPADLQNVVDLVGGAGAPGATVTWQLKHRRPVDTWEAPRALSAADMAYLGGNAAPAPPVEPRPTPPSCNCNCQPEAILQELQALKEQLKGIAELTANAIFAADQAKAHAADARKALQNGLGIELHDTLGGWGRKKGSIPGVARG